MQHTRIEWVKNPDGSPGYSWNPIKGLCPVGCWYCYARRIYQRFRWAQKPWLDIFELNQVAKTRLTGKRIFVCSTFELFHPIVDDLTGRCIRKDEYGRRESRDKARNMIFDVIRRRPDLTFIILTKMPERIDRPMPENVWLGVTCDGHNLDEDNDRLVALDKAMTKIKFISYEPLLSCPRRWPGSFRPDWIILGRLTPRGGPDFVILRGWIESIVSDAKDQGVPIFLKNNLRKDWPGPLIQEFPKEAADDRQES